MKSKLIVLILIAAVVAIVIGCGGNPVRDKVEKSVEQSLPGIIGPAESYSVQAYGPTLKMINGKLDGLDIIGNNVKLQSGINVSRLFIKIRDITFDTDTRQIKKVGSTEYSASITQEELTRCLRERYPEISDLDAALHDNIVTVSAKPGMSLLRAPVKVDAGIEIKQEQIIAINLKKVKVVGVNAPDFAMDYLESKLGTIFDAGDLGFDAKIRSAVIGPGTLTFDGKLDLMKAIEKRNINTTGANAG